MKRLYYVIAILLSIGALYYTFKNVPFQSIWAYSLSINYFWVMIAIVINCISFLIRAYRWQVIVNEVHLLKFWPAYHFTAIAFMMNNLLPGRVGELARPIMLKQRNNLPITTGLTTVVTERLFDLIFLCLLYLVVVMFVDIDPNYRMEIGDFTLSHELLTSLAVHVFWLFFGIIVCIICININFIRSLIKSGLIKIPQHMFFVRPAVKNFLLDKCIQPVIKIIDHVASGFSFFKRPAVMFHCFMLSVILWFLIAFSNYIMTFGCKNLDIGFIEICAVMVIICFFVSLPSVPGSWGLWEAGGIFALTIFGVGEQEATGFTIVNHAIQIFPIIVAGLVSLMITGISIRSSRNSLMEDDMT